MDGKWHAGVSLGISLGLFLLLVGGLRAMDPPPSLLGGIDPPPSPLRGGKGSALPGRGRLGEGEPRYQVKTVMLPTGVARWPKDLAVDGADGVAYVADGKRGTLTIVAGTSLIQSIPLGQLATTVGVDPGQGWVYVSVPDPYALYAGNIAIIRNGTFFTRVVAGGIPGPIAVDARHHRAYIGVQTAVPYSDRLAIFQQERLLSAVSVPPGLVAVAVDPERGRAYVLSRAGPSLSVINGTTNSAIVTLPELGIPRDLAVDQTSGQIYVVGQPADDAAGTVVILEGIRVIHRLAVGADPQRIEVDAVRGRVYITNAGDHTVTVISGTTMLETVRVGRRPVAIGVDPLHDRVYVANAGDGTTTVLSSQGVVATLPVGGGPLGLDVERGVTYLAGNGLAVVQQDRVIEQFPPATMPACVAVQPESGLVYTCNRGTDSVSVVSNTEVITTVAIQGTPEVVATDPLNGWLYVAHNKGLDLIQGMRISETLPFPAWDVAPDPARNRAYAAGEEVLVLEDGAILERVAIGDVPRNVAVNRAMGWAYASAGGQIDGFVAVISGTTHVKTIHTGSQPAQLAVDPVRDRVYVQHPAEGRLSIIQGWQRVFPSLFLPRPALDMAVNPLTGALYVATRGPLLWIRDPAGGVVDLGIEALAVEVDVQRDLAYATTREGEVVVLQGSEVVKRVPAGHRPLALAVDSSSGRVYVANFGADTLTLLEPDRVAPQQTSRLYLPLIR